MRVIFSRKGFDSASGGCPSPILDGRPVPLPIPTRQPTAVTYGHLEGDYAALVTDLTRGKLTSLSRCHLDPDIDASCLSRQSGWRGSLGQISIALSHLDKQGVTIGDLFVFWGCYREAVRRAGRWTFTGPTVHMAYGWLQVGERHQLGQDGSHMLDTHTWLTDHPHARPGWGNANAIFIASDTLSIPGLSSSAPGWGVFARGYQLSAPARNPSVWQVPEWLHPACGGYGMSYHDAPRRWFADGSVQCVPRGQEFVANVHNDTRIGQWLEPILASNR